MSLLHSQIRRHWKMCNENLFNFAGTKSLPHPPVDFNVECKIKNQFNKIMSLPTKFMGNFPNCCCDFWKLTIERQRCVVLLGETFYRKILRQFNQNFDSRNIINGPKCRLYCITYTELFWLDLHWLPSRYIFYQNIFKTQPINNQLLILFYRFKQIKIRDWSILITIDTDFN